MDQRELWDAEAATFDDEADHGLADPATREAWRALLLGVLPPAPARIADLGCGTGSLSVLLAEEGYAVDGLALSPEMVARARAKADAAGVSVDLMVGDAQAPGLPPASYDVVLSRPVLWAMDDPALALERWLALLASGGTLLLVEGSWSTGAGITAAQAAALVRETGREADVRLLPEPVYWGKEIADERYLLVSASPR
jgi:SAM-dependent methyltransferase